VIAQADKSLESLASATIIKNRGITSRWHPETLRGRILAIAQVKDKIDFIEGDGFEVCEKNANGEDVVYFCWQQFRVQINWVVSDWAKIEPVLRGQPFMLSDELGMQLHDRETIGESLTIQEKAQLEAWYAQKDAAETAMLEAAQVPLPNLVMLQDRVNATIEQLADGVQRLHQITQENKSLREEIAEIKRQFTIPRSA
jgi:regulator of replication initiation timing